MTVIDQLEMKLCTYSVQQLRAYLVRIVLVVPHIPFRNSSLVMDGVEATTTKMLNK